MDGIRGLSRGQIRMLVAKYLQDNPTPGTIIGYTKLNNNNSSTNASAAATTSYTTISSNHKVTFVARSSNVEINFRGYYAGLDGTDHNSLLYLALSTAATFSTLNSKYERAVWEADEDDNMIIDVSWFLTGLTPSTEYTYWIGHKATAASDYLHQYGGSNTSYYPDCVIRAISLPEDSSIHTDIS